MKRSTLLRYVPVGAALLLGAFFAKGVNAADVNDRVIAIVNDDVITMSELLSEGGSNVQGEPSTVLKNGMTVKEARDIVLEQLILRKLLDQAVKGYGLDITEIDVDRAIAEQLKMKGLNRQDLMDLLAKEGKTYQEYRKEVEYSIKKERLIGRKLATHIIVTDDEIAKYFDEHKAEFAGRKQFRISEIVFPVPADATSDAVAEVGKKADMVMKKIRAGASFEAMASEYSAAPDADKGGDMGFINSTTLDPGFAALLGTMKTGQVSDVVATGNGFLLFKVTDSKPIESVTVEDVKPEIIEAIKRERTMGYFEQWMKELRSKAFVEKML